MDNAKIEHLDNWPERHLYRVISSHDIERFKPQGCLTPNMSIGHFG